MVYYWIAILLGNFAECMHLVDKKWIVLTEKIDLKGLNKLRLVIYHKKNIYIQFNLTLKRHLNSLKHKESETLKVVS